MSLPDLGVAVAWLGAAVAARATGRMAALMAWVGAAWLLADADASLVLLHRGALAHVLLAYPSGRIGSRAAGAAVLAAYAAAVLGAALPGEGWTLGFAIALPIAALVRLTGAHGAVRGSRVAPLGVATAVGAMLAAAARSGADLLGVYQAVLAAAALVLAADLRAAPWSRAALTGLIVDLGRRPAGGPVRERLARAIGDPSAVVGYVVEEGRPPVDEQGRTVPVPEPGAERAVTWVEHDGRPLAVVVHDPEAPVEPDVLAGAASVLSVAVANARLQAGVRSLMGEIEASTRRLVDAGGAERRRLAAELRAHVVPPLDEAALALAGAGAEDLRERLASLNAELMGFAEGLDPVALHEGGLAPALRALAERAGLPISLTLPSRRYDPEIETCAWFVCSEAIANALKHAEASRLSIRVAATGRVLQVEVADDGRGDAQPVRGSGLRRLAERVAASGGRLTIESRAGRGTRLLADF